MVVLLLFCLLKQLQGLIVSETLTSMVEVEQAGKTRLLLSSVSAESWNPGRLPPTTLPDVVSCAAHCENLRQEDSCSCNAIMFVKENGDCIVGTARLPMKGEDTEKLFIVEGTGGWLGKQVFISLKKYKLADVWGWSSWSKYTRQTQHRNRTCNKAVGKHKKNTAEVEYFS